MNKIFFMLPLFMIAGLFLLEPIALTSAQVVATAPANDVTRVIWSGTGYSISTGAYAPEINIIEVDYNLVGINGTITVKFQGTPILSNHTYYYAELTDPNSQFIAYAYFSGYDTYGSQDWSNATYYLVSGNGANFQSGTNSTNVIQGNSLVFTFPGQWADSTSIWNSTVDASWTWNVYAYEWIGTSKTDTSVGTWYYNYYPADNNPYYTSGTNSSSSNASSGTNSSKKLPGFELISVVAGLFVVVPLYLYRRNQSNK